MGLIPKGLAWLTVGMGALPLLAAVHTPLADWPGHVMRVGILSSLWSGDPLWGRYYELNGLILPNAASDYGVALLQAAGLPLHRAAQVFLLLSYALFAAGWASLLRAFDRADPVRLTLVGLLFFNGVMLGGCVNYMFGLALLVPLLAAWYRAGPRSRIMVAVAAAVLLFAAHLIGALLFVAVTGLIELAALWRTRSLAPRILAQHLSALVALGVVAGLLLASPALTPTAESGDGIVYLGGPSLVGVAKYKLTTIVHGFVDGLGVRGAAITGLGCAALLTIGGWSLRRRALQLHAPAGFPPVCLGLMVLYLAAPYAIGNGAALDIRLLPAVALIVIAMPSVTWRSRRLHAACLAVAVVFSAGRSVSLLADIPAEARVYAGYAAGSQGLAADSVMLVALGTSVEQIPWGEFWAPPMMSLPDLAAGRGTLVPNVFAYANQHTIRLKPAYRAWRGINSLRSEAEVTASFELFARVCGTWQADGHAGAVYLTVLYPSPRSDMLFAAHRTVLRDPKYQVVALCGA